MVNIKGILKEWERPAVMGILNLTADSFYAPSRVDSYSMLHVAERMLADGCDILDLGACSTRPGSEPVCETEEIRRLPGAIGILRTKFGSVAEGGPLISVDTFRASVAEVAVGAGADIINDVGGGDLDPEMFATVARLKVPYILTHMRGTPANMQSLAEYEDVTADVLRDLAFKKDRLNSLGVVDVIIDPGFGFPKNLGQNYELLARLNAFKELNAPLLVGISRKSMICKELGITPSEALDGTTALHMAALMAGADILRVHDVKPARQTVKLFMALSEGMPAEPRTIKSIDKTSDKRTERTL